MHLGLRQIQRARVYDSLMLQLTVNSIGVHSLGLDIGDRVRKRGRYVRIVRNVLLQRVGTIGHGGGLRGPRPIGQHNRGRPGWQGEPGVALAAAAVVVIVQP